MVQALNLIKLRNLVVVMAIFDTLKAFNRLKEAGIPSAHAEAGAEVLSEIFADNLQELVTKEDLHAVKVELQHEMHAVKSELQHEIHAVKSELRHEISDLRKDIDLKLEQTTSTLRSNISDSKFELIKWFVGISITQIGLIIAILKFLPGTI